jgi:hypothetical protein
VLESVSRVLSSHWQGPKASEVEQDCCSREGSGGQRVSGVFRGGNIGTAMVAVQHVSREQ